MSIEKQPNGRYKVYVDVKQAGGTKRRRIVRRVDTEAEAEELERTLRGLGEHGTHTVADIVNRYLFTYGPALAPNTENGYRGILRRYIAGTALADLPVWALDGDELLEHYGRLFAGTYRPDGTPLATNTVKSVHRLLSVSFANAPRKWITTNPCDGVKVRGPVTPARADADYDLGTIAAVLDAGDRDLEDLVHVALATGAREGELAGLRWSDVDLLGGVVSFSGSVSRKRENDGPGWIRKTTKTGRPRRVRIDQAAADVLAARYGRQAAEAAALCLEPERLERCAVFSLELEEDLTSPSALGARWRRAAEKVGASMRFHDLRHVNASEMMAANVPIASATARNGWSSSRMFLDLYGRHRAEVDGTAVDALDGAWQRVNQARTRPNA
jgi:integrase